MKRKITFRFLTAAQASAGSDIYGRPVSTPISSSNTVERWCDVVDVTTKNKEAGSVAVQSYKVTLKLNTDFTRSLNDEMWFEYGGKEFDILHIEDTYQTRERLTITAIARGAG